MESKREMKEEEIDGRSQTQRITEVKCRRRWWWWDGKGGESVQYYSLVQTKSVDMPKGKNWPDSTRRRR